MIIHVLIIIAYPNVQLKKHISKYFILASQNKIIMSVLQNVHVLSVNGAPVGTQDLTFPGVCPTAASPCPVFGLSNKHITGVAVPTANQVAAFPTAQGVVYMNWNVQQQRFTGTIYTSETAAAIVTAGA